MSKKGSLSFNINENVKIKLTKLGEKILLEKHTKLRADILLRTNNDAVGPYSPRKTDSEGYTEMQLWQVMQDFGPHMGLGNELPIEPTIRFPYILND